MMSDEYEQADAPEDVYVSDSGKKVKRGTKGNRKAQAKRYQEKNRARLNEYKRKYMAARKAASIQAP